MKHIKLFEEYNNQSDIQVGDYVICDPEPFADELQPFIRSNIGQCSKYDEDATFPYVIYYENAPEDLFEKSYPKHLEVDHHEIIHFSSNKEDLEIFISVNKYNL